MRALLAITVAAATLIGVTAHATPVSSPSATITITGDDPPKCGITGGTSATIGVDLSGSDGFINGGLEGALLSALNSTNTYAWCTGTSNKINLTRTPLVRDGSNGHPDANGFLTAALFDVGIDMPDVTNPAASYDEGTSDGPGTGPTVGPFGPTGAGSPVTWVPDSWPNPNGHLVTVVGVDVGGQGTTGNGPTSAFSQINDKRLVAGDYTATVTLTLTPGL
jgi:hypothetical protein